MTEPLFDVAPKLTDRQQFVYDLLEVGASRPLTAGVFLHAHQECEFCKPKAPCRFAHSSGREVLEALRRKGLVKRDRRHMYRRTDAMPATPHDLSPDEEFGF